MGFNGSARAQIDPTVVIIRFNKHTLFSFHKSGLFSYPRITSNRFAKVL